MEFFDVINERYSVRGYLDKPVEKEKLDYVLKAATIAPTGVNYQPFKVYVIDAKKHSLKSMVPDGLLKHHTYCASWL